MVLRGELEQRLDVPFYLPEIVELEKKVKAISTYKLSHFVKRMASGSTPSVQEEEKYYSDKLNGVPFIRVQNLNPTNDLSLDDLKYINLETHQNYLKRSQVEENDLLVKITGVGRMAVSSIAPKGFIGNTNQHLVVIKTENLATSEVLATFLNTDIGEKLATRRATGGTRPALDYTALRSIPIVFLPKMVEVIKKAVEEKRQKEAEAQALLSSIDNYLLSALGITLSEAAEKEKVFKVCSKVMRGGRFDPYYYANQAYKIEGGMYENHSLRTVAYLERGQSITKDSIKSGDYPVIAGGQTSPYTHQDFNQIGNIITVSASGAYSGYVWYHDYPIFASDCTVIKSKDENTLITKFLAEILKLKQKEIYNLQQGSGQPHVYASDLSRLMIPLPSIEKQIEMLEHINNLRACADTLATEAKEVLEIAKAEVERMILGGSKI